MDILGIKIDQINLTQTIEQINTWISENPQRHIVTVNPEFVVAAQKNKEFKEVINHADMNACDGIGLVYAGKFLIGEKLTRVTGVDLVKNLLDSPNRDYKIYMLGGEEGVASKLIEKYITKEFFNKEKLVGAESGGKLNTKNWELENNEETIQRIIESGANILLVAFGQVKQEMWIRQNLHKIPNVKVAIGIGGTFDYLSGKIKRPSKMVRDLGLEWLYRLITQPKRAGRIFNATAKFGILTIRELLTNNFSRK